MTHLFTPAPAIGVPMLASRPSPSSRDLIALRRSMSKQMIGAPGPSGEELTELLKIAARVPDHRRLGPWRFIVFEGEARDAFGIAAAEIQKQEQPDATELMLETTKGYFLRAPTVIAVVSSPKNDPKQTPIWEQELSVGALCQNLLLAANASGWAGCWLSEWVAYSGGINTLLGLEASERIAGYIYLGTAKANPQERMRPDLSERITHWTP